MVELFALEGPRPYLYSADWAPEDEYGLGGANREIRLYAADTDAHELRLVDTMLDEAWSAVVRWSADGRHALSGGNDGTVHQSGMDGRPRVERKRIVTGGHYDTIHLSVFEDGGLTTVAEHPDNGLGIHAASWSPDEDYMVLAAANVDRIALLDARGCPTDL